MCTHSCSTTCNPIGSAGTSPQSPVSLAKPKGGSNCLIVSRPASKGALVGVRGHDHAGATAPCGTGQF